MTFSNCASLRLQLGERVLGRAGNSLALVPQTQYLAAGQTLTSFGWRNSEEEVQTGSGEQSIVATRKLLVSEQIVLVYRRAIVSCRQLETFATFPRLMETRRWAR